MKEIILGFSGGVDSAVSALLLRRNGYDVRGVYLYSGDDNACAEAKKGASAMDIELEVMDVCDKMEQLVAHPFEESYLNGFTPSPCIGCNRNVKFASLLRAADARGIREIATGHYARSENGEIFCGHPDNDQSYMLCMLTREQAERTVFPLAGMAKGEVRELARGEGLLAAKKPDSTEICFIPGIDYREWMMKRGNEPSPGILIFHGESAGTHDGYWRYTVGQRLPGLYDGRKRYVSRIVPETDTVELSLWEELFKRELLVRDFNWLVQPSARVIRASVRVRHTRWEQPCCTVVTEKEAVRIVCDEPVRAPAPGQYAVLYDGRRLLGGGVIVSSE